jgi:O-glycosyl hydrolase
MVENPDGSRVVVLGNSADARSVTVQLAGAATEIHLEKNAVATLTWR